MAIFTVISTEADPTPLKAAIERASLDHFELAPNAWLVVGTGLARNISDQLGLTNGESGTGIVLTSIGYYGYASNAIWEWLALKRAAGLAS